MAVTSDYLKRVRLGLRLNAEDDVDAELTEIIEECRQDLVEMGVLATKANSETDSLVLGAVRSFARWKYPLNDASAAMNRDDYMMQRDELRRRSTYTEVT